MHVVCQICSSASVISTIQYKTLLLLLLLLISAIISNILLSALYTYIFIHRKRQTEKCKEIKTRKLCYRKDDRTMRHIHGCPENFRDSLTTPTATIPNSFYGLLFGSTLWMFLQNLKSVALSVPQIIVGTPKIWTVHGYALAPFSPKCLIGFYSDWPYKCTRQICSQ